MYRIVGRNNLEAVNYTAQQALIIIDNIKTIEGDNVTLDKNKLLNLSANYLALYSAILEHGLMPSITNLKHKTFTVH